MHTTIQIQNITGVPMQILRKRTRNEKIKHIRFIYIHTCQPEEQVTSTAPAMSNTPAHQTIENGMHPKGFWMVEKVGGM